MPAERLPMRQIREIFRLKWEKPSQQAENSRKYWNSPEHGKRIPSPGRGGRFTLASSAGNGRGRNRGPVISNESHPPPTNEPNRIGTKFIKS